MGMADYVRLNNGNMIKQSVGASPNVTWTRVRVSVSDSGAGVRFVRIFGDTANNTWNPTRVSESDTGAGYPTRQKN